MRPKSNLFFRNVLHIAAALAIAITGLSAHEASAAQPRALSHHRAGTPFHFLINLSRDYEWSLRQNPPSQSAIQYMQSLADRYDYISQVRAQWESGGQWVYGSWNYPYFRNTNPGITLGEYANPLNWAGGNFPLSAIPEHWFLHDPVNDLRREARLVTPWYTRDPNINGYNEWIYDMGNPDFQRFFAQQIVAGLQQGLDAFWIDGAGFMGEQYVGRFTRYRDGALVVPLNPRTGRAYTTAEQQADSIAMARAVRQAIDAAFPNRLSRNGVPIMLPVNIADQVWQNEWEVVEAYGAMLTEGTGWFSPAALDEYSQALWRIQVDNIKEAMRRGLPTVLLTKPWVDEVAWPGNSRLLFVYASALLGAGAPNDRLYLRYNYHSMDNWGGFDVDIGHATGDYFLFPGSRNIYARWYERALVLVNPSGTVETVNPNVTYRPFMDYSDRGGNDVMDWRGLGVAQSGPVTVRPYEGAILVVASAPSPIPTLTATRISIQDKTATPTTLIPTATTIPPTATPQATSGPVPAGVVANGDFEQGQTGWTFFGSPAAGGVASFAAGRPAFQGNAGAQVAITTVSPDKNVQLYQANVGLQPNTRYRLTFAATSSTGHDMWIQLIQHGAPYATYGLSKNVVDVTTQWYSYQYEFTTPNFGGAVNDGRLMFFFGDNAQNGDVYALDNIVLTALPTTSVPPTRTQTQAPTATHTSVPPTATATFTPPSPTATHTPMPPTVTPTLTRTALPTQPPSATFTASPVPPTATQTTAPPTATLTSVPPTETQPPTATVPPATRDLITNGDFEQSLAAWKYFASPGTGGEVLLDTTTDAYEGAVSARVSVTTVPTDRNVQLYQTEVVLQPNTRYMLTFAATSNTGHDLWLQLIQHGEPYANYGLSNTVVDVTEAWSVYRYEFTTPSLSGPVSDARLMFFFGDHAQRGDEYRLDAISLTSLKPTPTPVPLATIVPSATPTLTSVAPPAIRINFQKANVAVPEGYLADTGRRFGDQGNGYQYGWSAENRTGRDRDAANSADQRYDTLIHMQKPATCNGSCQWEIALPNGTYRVRVVAGDAKAIDSVYRLNVENVLVIDGQPNKNQRWFDNTVTVTISDGRLTLSNAAGAQNNKVNFLEITTP